MPSGIPVSRAVKREFFDLVCRGMATTEASVKVGASRRMGWLWWREAGGMTLRKGKSGIGGLASAGDLERSGGLGHRISFEERIEIMRGRDAGLSWAEIGRRIGRDRTVVWREHQRNRLPNGDYHALMAHARAAENARRPKDFKLKDIPLCTTEGIPDFNRGYVEAHTHYGALAEAERTFGSQDAIPLDRLTAGDTGRPIVELRRADLDESRRQYRAECDRCKYRPSCEGVWGNYLTRRGWDEFVPVTG